MLLERVLLTLMLLTPACSSEPDTERPASADRTANTEVDPRALTSVPTQDAQPPALADGPHLFHRKDGTVEALWVENGQKKSKTFKKGDPIELPRFASLIGPSMKLGGHAPGPAIIEAPKKMLVLSDVEGEYDTLVALLRANGVIDDKNHWAFGKGHLVTVGDMVDRGDQVTEVLWLCYRLEREAKAAGGGLHFVLGNHEAMIMANDLRYIAPKYLEVTKTLGMTYDKLVGADTEIGRWLRSRHIVMRIGRWIFVHGGLAPEIPIDATNLEDSNKRIRGVLGIDPTTAPPHADRLAWAFAWSGRGPFWYRGYFPDFSTDGVFGPTPPQKDIDALVERLGGETIVVGHTKVTTPTFMFNGKVLAIDTPWTYAPGIRAMLVTEKGEFWVDVKGKRTPATK